MKAVFTTLCGCTRTVEIPEAEGIEGLPRSKTMSLPMSRRIVSKPDIQTIANDRFRERLFILTEVRFEKIEYVAYYLEKE